MSDGWRFRAPAMLVEVGLCSRGEPDATSLDRRWLWRLEGFLSVSGTNEDHHAMARDLKAYLYETCEHHWHGHEADPDIPAHKQCLYCNDAVWEDTDGQ